MENFDPPFFPRLTREADRSQDRLQKPQDRPGSMIPPDPIRPYLLDCRGGQRGTEIMPLRETRKPTPIRF